MNCKKLIESMKDETVKLSSEERKQLLSRGAVTQLPLMVGQVITFPSPCDVLIQNVNGNKVPMVVGTIGDAYDEEGEAARISLVSFGRCFTNPQTKVTSTPVTIAETGTDPAKLVYTKIKDLSLEEVPAEIAGKTVVIRGIQTFNSVNADGTTRTNAQGQPMFQTVYAFEFK